MPAPLPLPLPPLECHEVLSSPEATTPAAVAALVLMKAGARIVVRARAHKTKSLQPALA